MRNLRDFLGYLNRQLLEEVDVFSATMLDRMNEFFRKFVSSTTEQVESLSKHMKLISDRLGTTHTAALDSESNLL